MKTTIDGAPGAGGLGQVERGRREERDADELWALALAGTLLAELPKLARAPAGAGAPTRADAEPAPAGASPELDEPSSPRAAAGALADRARAGDPAGAAGAGDGPELPSSLSAEVSDERLGRLQLHVARAEGGLDIVINVADARVKALIEAEHGQLLKTLKEAGLHVTSVQVGSPSRAGTALAQDRGGAEKARAGASFRQPAARWRTYTGPPAEEEDADGEGVHLTA